jgi:hypothetical protein
MFSSLDNLGQAGEHIQKRIVERGSCELWKLVYLEASPERLGQPMKEFPRTMEGFACCSSMDPWQLKGIGSGLVLISSTGEQLHYTLQIQFDASNNDPKYEGLTIGLGIVAAL